jgi:hypothetical protein
MALENIPYNIHKVTLLSFEPEISAIQIKKMFGDDIEKQNILDIVIKKRGARWFKFKYGARSEIHLIEPFKLKYNALLRQIDREQKIKNPLKFGIFENHVGIYVPDLTEIINRIVRHNNRIKNLKQINKTKYSRNKGNKIDKNQKSNKTIKNKSHGEQGYKLGIIQYVLFQRRDGMNQLYVDLHGCIDYLEIDSFNYDYTKTINKLKPIRFETDLTKQTKKIKK